MLDRRGRPWLLEVNHAPSFACGSPLDEMVRLNSNPNPTPNPNPNPNPTPNQVGAELVELDDEERVEFLHSNPSPNPNPNP